MGPPTSIHSIQFATMSTFVPSMSNTFTSLLSTYNTWPALKAYLTSEEGGKLRVMDASETPDHPYALIRYVKGQSNLSLPHVRAFRSVVWDTIAHRPVSVTPPKSADGESVPDGDIKQCRLTQFLDGVLIGVFFDPYTNDWEFHTRSTIGAHSRYYSSDSFRALFIDAANYAGLDRGALRRDRSYSFVLMHPENRIVCPVTAPAAFLVQSVQIGADGSLTDCTATEAFPQPMTVPNVASWSALRERVADWNRRFGHKVQGVVITDATGNRWKLRTPAYNRARNMRGNNARLDYMYLTHWRAGTLAEYLRVYPEEKAAANAIVDAWKTATNNVFRIYTDVFKARTMSKADIPPKYRPLVYGLHSKFMEELKPAGKSLDWKTTLAYMNTRDIPQMLFVLNWDLRAATGTAKEQTVSVPIEHADTSAAPVDTPATTAE